MRAKFDAAGEVAIVTGGASGIGAEFARGYAAAGGTAVVFDVEPRPDMDLRPGRVLHFSVDVSDRAAVVTAVARVVDTFGRIDGLVAGAAIQPRVDLVETPAELWERTIAVNLNGVVWACQAVVPQMLAQRSGAIVAYSSGLARFGRGQAAAYAASKGAIEPFVKSLAAEVAGAGIRVNVIYPGVIDTEQFQRANPTGPEREHWQRTTGIGTPADVLGPLLFLLSDAATMSGSTLTRDRAYPETTQEGNDGE